MILMLLILKFCFEKICGENLFFFFFKSFWWSFGEVSIRGVTATIIVGRVKNLFLRLLQYLKSHLQENYCVCFETGFLLYFVACCLIHGYIWTRGEILNREICKVYGSLNASSWELSFWFFLFFRIIKAENKNNFN